MAPGAVGSLITYQLEREADFFDTLAALRLDLALFRCLENGVMLNRPYFFERFDGVATSASGLSLFSPLRLDPGALIRAGESCSINFCAVSLVLLSKVGEKSSEAPSL